MYNSPNILDRMKTKIAVKRKFSTFFFSSSSYNKNRHTNDATKIKKEKWEMTITVIYDVFAKICITLVRNRCT